MVPEGIYILDSMHFIIGKNLTFLCSVLNSKLMQWFLSITIGCAAGGNSGNADNVLNLSVPEGHENIELNDNDIYNLYQLKDTEIRFIENQM